MLSPPSLSRSLCAVGCFFFPNEQPELCAFLVPASLSRLEIMITVQGNL